MNQNTDENTHSPTSAFAAVRILLILGMIYDLAVTALDIKDAFLVVPQPEDEPMFVLIPEWIQALKPECKHNIWRLRRCLPGQRSAAQHWFAFFTGLCKRAGLVSFPGCPTVLKLVDKDHHIYLTVHVHDVLLVCNDKDLIEMVPEECRKGAHYEGRWATPTRLWKDHDVPEEANHLFR